MFSGLFAGILVVLAAQLALGEEAVPFGEDTVTSFDLNDPVVAQIAKLTVLNVAAAMELKTEGYREKRPESEVERRREETYGIDHVTKVQLVQVTPDIRAYLVELQAYFLNGEVSDTTFLFGVVCESPQGDFEVMSVLPIEPGVKVTLISGPAVHFDCTKRQIGRVSRAVSHAFNGGIEEQMEPDTTNDLEPSGESSHYNASSSGNFSLKRVVHAIGLMFGEVQDATDIHYLLATEFQSKEHGDSLYAAMAVHWNDDDSHQIRNGLQAASDGSEWKEMDRQRDTAELIVHASGAFTSEDQNLVTLNKLYKINKAVEKKDLD